MADTQMTWSASSDANADLLGKSIRSETGSLFKRFHAAGPGPGSEALAAATAKHQEGRRHQKNMVSKITVGLVDTYAKSNKMFNYSFNANPKRVLTKPSEGTKNEGYDNDDSDYILYVGDSLINHQPSSGILRHYVVKEMLGQGTFGQVASCWCEEQEKYVAVKVIKNQPAYYHQARVEIGLLQLLNTRFDPKDEHHIVRMTDFFLFRKHLCIVFEQLDVNLFELLKRNAFRGLSLNLVQLFARQILDSLTVLRDAHVIHCDLKPENILLKNAHSGEVKTIDFGSACFENRTVYSYIQSRFYRAPEVVLGTMYNTAIDMWSFGCVAAELFLGLPLFPGASEHDLLSRIVETIGRPPHWLMTEAKHTDKFFRRALVQGPVPPSEHHGFKYVLMSQSEFEYENGCKAPAGKRYFQHSSLPDIINAYPMKSTLGDEEVARERKHRDSFIDFLLGVLDMDPRTRWTPYQAAAHPFITGAPFKGPFQPPRDVRMKAEPPPKQLEVGALTQPVPASGEETCKSAEASAAAAVACGVGMPAGNVAVAMQAAGGLGSTAAAAAAAAAVAVAASQTGAAPIGIGAGYQSASAVAMQQAGGASSFSSSMTGSASQMQTLQQQQSAHAQAHAIAMATLQHLGPKLGFQNNPGSVTNSLKQSGSVTDVLYLGGSLPTSSLLASSFPFGGDFVSTMASSEQAAASTSASAQQVGTAGSMFPAAAAHGQPSTDGPTQAMMMPHHSLAHGSAEVPQAQGAAGMQGGVEQMQQHMVQLGATPSVNSHMGAQGWGHGVGVSPGWAAWAPGGGTHGASSSMNIAAGNKQGIRNNPPPQSSLNFKQSFQGGTSLVGNFFLGGLSPADYRHVAAVMSGAAAGQANHSRQPVAAPAEGPGVPPQSQQPQQPMQQFGFNIPSQSMYQGSMVSHNGSRLSPMEEGDKSSPSPTGFLVNNDSSSALKGPGTNQNMQQHMQFFAGMEPSSSGMTMQKHQQMQQQLASQLGFGQDQLMQSDSPAPGNSRSQMNVDTDMISGDMDGVDTGGPTVSSSAHDGGATMARVHSQAAIQNPADWDPLFSEEQLLDEGSKHGNNDAASALKLALQQGVAGESQMGGAGAAATGVAGTDGNAGGSGRDGNLHALRDLPGEGPRMMRLAGTAMAMDIPSSPAVGMEDVEDAAPPHPYLSFSLPYSGVLPPAGHLLPSNFPQQTNFPQQPNNNSKP